MTDTTRVDIVWPGPAVQLTDDMLRWLARSDAPTVRLAAAQNPPTAEE